ncbi:MULTISPECIES: DUF1870 family protein [Pseudoalteromonas]|uniref:Aca2/YdiL-like domain-containing protein n=1 Tax=Pseudoalteromonas TaxID=53246 RepID=UPI001582C0D3|nr:MULTISPECIES: DUF1870 family protein [Pseudoalteromonas]MDI4654571.1 YdiL family protein [Pseudoalteromonas shioyasakiensis]NUJ40160.1 DUF1870 family protein [Pseudoalteromonas sp. 0303]
MSWQKLNNFELQALRKLLYLDVSEAAEFVGKVANRTWQYWESGRSQVPKDIDYEMYGLLSQRNQLIDETLLETHEQGDVGVLKCYHTFDAFVVDYPHCTKLMWRLHQSVLAHFFAEGGEVGLEADIPVNKESYIYKWFNGLTEQQIEDAKVQEIFRRKGIVD